MNKNTIYRILSSLIPALVIWIFLISQCRDWLLQVESRSLFLFDWFWIKEYGLYPSGPLACVSQFLAQFLHLPWLGSLIWVLLLTLASEVTVKTYGISPDRKVLAWIPSFILTGANISLGYLLYIMDTPGYFFEPVLGYLLIPVTVRLSRKVPDRFIIPAIAAWVVVGYWFAGYYIFMAVLASVIDIFRSDRKRKFKYAAVTTTLFVTLLSPMIYFGLSTYRLEAGWTLGLPATSYIETRARTFLPVMAATLIPAVIPFLGFLRRPARRTVLSGTSVFAVCIVLLYLSWFRDVNYNAEIRMIQAADEMDWKRCTRVMQDVSRIADRKKGYKPTRPMVLLNELALIKNGQEGQTGFAFDNGDAPQKNSHEIPMVLQIGKIVYLHYGIPGFCHRWCLEETTEFGWSFSRIKYLTMEAVTLRDKAHALKNIGMLEHTLFYRKWADEQKKIVQDWNLTSKTKPYDQIMPLLCYDDEMNDDVNGIEYALSSHFTGKHPEQPTALYDRVALYWALKSQSSLLFWSKFFIYLESNNPTKLDRHYQEAAYLFSHIENNEALKALPYDKITQDLYDSMMQTLRKNESKLTSLEQARAILPNHLRQTYYYYYYFVRGLETF